MGEMDRRPIKSRNTNWARSFAAFLAKVGVTPNTISVFSVVFSGLALVFFYQAHGSDNYIVLFILAALCIQMRLICNLMDGMVAVEHNQTSPVGDMYNDVPDRFADLFIILGAGYAIRDLPFAVELGWMGASLAITTAYIRVLGKSIGTDSYFLGPMAKPHRMALITVSALLEIAAIHFDFGFSPIYYSLMILNIGCAITCWRRLHTIAKEKTRMAEDG